MNAQLGLTSAKRIWFDQSHDQHSWDWGPIPVIEEYGYRAAKESANEAGYEVKALRQRVTSREDLVNCDLLVMVAPYHTLLQPWEIDAIAKFVENGKSLLVMSYYTGDPHHENNLSELSKEFGVEFRTDQVEDPVHFHHHQYEILVEDVPQEHDILQGVQRLCFKLTCSLKVSDPAKVVLRSSPGSFTKEADVTDRGIIRSWTETANTEVPLLAVADYGDGRFAALGTWEIFLSDYLKSSEFDNCQLYLNLLRWLTAGQATMVERRDLPSAVDRAGLISLDYGRGLERLQRLLADQPSVQQSEFRVLEQRLRDNLDRERLYGSDEAIRSERAQIVDALNALTDRTGLESSFNDLCRE